MFERLKNTDKKMFILVLGMIGLCLLGSIILFIDSGTGYRGFRMSNAEFVWLILGVIVAAALVLEYYLAGLFYFLGADKGYTDKVYLWLAFLLPAVGYLLIIAMPDRGGNQQFASDELPDL